jgi:hypothetical protein
MQDNKAMRQAIEARLREEFERLLDDRIEEHLDWERENALADWEERRGEELRETLTQEFERLLDDRIQEYLDRERQDALADWEERREDDLCETLTRDFEEHLDDAIEKELAWLIDDDGAMV